MINNQKNLFLRINIIKKNLIYLQQCFFQREMGVVAKDLRQQKGSHLFIRLQMRKKIHKGILFLHMKISQIIILFCRNIQSLIKNKQQKRMKYLRNARSRHIIHFCINSKRIHWMKKILEFKLKLSQFHIKVSSEQNKNNYCNQAKLTKKKNLD